MDRILMVVASICLLGLVFLTERPTYKEYVQESLIEQVDDALFCPGQDDSFTSISMAYGGDWEKASKAYEDLRLLCLAQERVFQDMVGWLSETDDLPLTVAEKAWLDDAIPLAEEHVVLGFQESDALRLALRIEQLRGIQAFIKTLNEDRLNHDL